MYLSHLRCPSSLFLDRIHDQTYSKYLSSNSSYFYHQIFSCCQFTPFFITFFISGIVLFFAHFSCFKYSSYFHFSSLSTHMSQPFEMSFKCFILFSFNISQKSGTPYFTSRLLCQHDSYLSNEIAIVLNTATWISFGIYYLPKTSIFRVLNSLFAADVHWPISSFCFPYLFYFLYSPLIIIIFSYSYI